MSTSFLHEGFVRLFHDRPALAAELLRDVLGVDLARYTEARIESADLTDIEPAKACSDLAQLEAWLRRAGTVASTNELFST